MASPSRAQETMTLEDFLKLPEEKPYLEYIDGRIEAKLSAQKKHSVLQLRLLERLNRFAERRGLGLAFPELRCTFEGRSIVPDIAFLTANHLPVDDDGEFVEITTIPPDLHIEIRSPEQSRAGSHRKLLHSTSHGCSLGWLIDPYKKTIDVYRPGQVPEQLGLDGVLKGEPVLPRLRLRVAEVFGWLKPKPGSP